MSIPACVLQNTGLLFSRSRRSILLRRLTFRLSLREFGAWGAKLRRLGALLALIGVLTHAVFFVPQYNLLALAGVPLDDIHEFICSASGIAQQETDGVVAPGQEKPAKAPRPCPICANLTPAFVLPAFDIVLGITHSMPALLLSAANTLPAAVRLGRPLNRGPPRFL